MVIAVDGEDSANVALRTVLTMSGCRVTQPKPGVAALAVSEDGMELAVVDAGYGNAIEEEHVAALVALAYYQSGGRELAVLNTAPNAIEHVAERYGGRALRIGRDGSIAEETYAQQQILCDGIFSAAFLASSLASSGKRISEMLGELPDFSVMSCEVKIHRDRGSMMRAIADSCQGMHRELDEGLRVCTDGGWVHISPCVSKSALKITGEGMSEEIACELCAMFEERAKELDAQLAEENPKR